MTVGSSGGGGGEGGGEGGGWEGGGGREERGEEGGRGRARVLEPGVLLLSIPPPSSSTSVIASYRDESLLQRSLLGWSDCLGLGSRGATLLKRFNGDWVLRGESTSSPEGCALLKTLASRSRPDGLLKLDW